MTHPGRYIGIVSNDLDRVADYLGSATVGPYVVIRDERDVPDRLGGIALLDGDQLPIEFANALSSALLNEG